MNGFSRASSATGASPLQWDLGYDKEDPFNPAKPGPGFVMVSIVGLTNLANYWSIPIIESTLHPRPAKRGLGWRMLSIIGIDQEFFKLVNSTVESTSPGPSFAELNRASSWFDICGSARRASETFCAGSYRHTENTNCFILESRDIITGVAREVKEEIHKKHISCLNEQEICKDKHRDKKEKCKDKKKDKDKEKSDISEEAKVAVSTWGF
ncbi:hypothetical protein CQW23_32173 [Capsicum baccatum]|uniref:Uncharacterized protein n=1 Tax=Capsicum baccatum TaxID=33114 RepID=A0A2G2V5G1_CAPBA|nr:hypothetical protein CQW23_32173 [Capsicum baccatum]